MSFNIVLSVAEVCTPCNVLIAIFSFCSQASCILQLVKYIQKLQQKDVEVAEEVSALFAGELNPVAPKAQKKVPVPEG